MSRIIITISLSFLLFIPNILSGYSLQDTVEISGKTYLYGELADIIDAKMPDDIIEKYNLYQQLTRAIFDTYTGEQDLEKKEYYKKISDVIHIAKNAHEYFLSSQVHEIVLGYSHSGREMRGYFKGLPKNGYNLILSNIHGSYEYGTYETAMMLVDELKISLETSWFIIPTLNPDGLIEYENNGNLLSFYLSGRDNLRGVDLNRNYCSKNFKDIEIEKF